MSDFLSVLNKLSNFNLILHVVSIYVFTIVSSGVPYSTQDTKWSIFSVHLLHMDCLFSENPLLHNVKNNKGCGHKYHIGKSPCKNKLNYMYSCMLEERYCKKKWQHLVHKLTIIFHIYTKHFYIVFVKHSGVLLAILYYCVERKEYKKSSKIVKIYT